jgi:hypothetical protein
MNCNHGLNLLADLKIETVRTQLNVKYVKYLQIIQVTIIYIIRRETILQSLLTYRQKVQIFLNDVLSLILQKQ